MSQTRVLHTKNCRSCPIFAATTHSQGTGITYVRLPSESKTSGGSVVRALPSRYSPLCDSAARSQHMSLSLSLSTCTCHAGIRHSHLHGMHLRIQSLTPVRMLKKNKPWQNRHETAYTSTTYPPCQTHKNHDKTGMRLPQMLHSKPQRLAILNTPHSKTHAHLTKNR